MRRVGVVVLAIVLVMAAVACGSSSSSNTGSAKFTSSDAIAAFKAAGLEAENTKAMDPSDYGMAPLTAAEGTRFLIPSMGADKGGRAMSFTSDADLQKVKDYYEGLGKNSAALYSWVFVKDNVLVQINGTLPKDQADKYDAALQGI